MGLLPRARWGEESRHTPLLCCWDASWALGGMVYAGQLRLWCDDSSKVDPSFHPDPFPLPAAEQYPVSSCTTFA